MFLHLFSDVFVMELALNAIAQRSQLGCQQQFCRALWQHLLRMRQPALAAAIARSGLPWQQLWLSNT